MNQPPILRTLQPFMLVLSLLIIGPFTAAADSKKSGPGKFGKRIAGTYLVREAPDETEIFLRLITLTADGNWFSIDAHQQNFGFTDEQGVWKKSGRREITANVIDFDIGQGGIPTGVTRIRFLVNFSKDFQEVSGEFFGESFLLSQDPLDPDEVPERTFEDIFKGKRVNVTLKDEKAEDRDHRDDD